MRRSPFRSLTDDVHQDVQRAGLVADLLDGGVPLLLRGDLELDEEGLALRDDVVPFTHAVKEGCANAAS